MLCGTGVWGSTLTLRQAQGHFEQGREVSPTRAKDSLIGTKGELLTPKTFGYFWLQK
jgi:hypothetical protein